MSKQVQDAYIVSATRLPIGKSGRGYFKNTRPDEMLVKVMQAALAQAPGLEAAAIEDAIVGCSFPEGEQGMNIARVASVLAGFGPTIGGVTINRYCASGITAVQMAADRIRVGEADVMFAGGVESMSMIPMGGNKPSLSPLIFERDENIGIAYGMGLTAEKVAEQWKIGRDAQDAFALQSHQRALAAIAAGEFRDEMTPFEIIERFPNLLDGTITEKRRTVEVDEGPRADTSIEGLSKLKPVFGYLHRNHEKIAENTSYLASMPYTDRLDYFCSLTNNWAYALSVEKLAGLQVPERAEYIRLITAELTRVLNHTCLAGFLLQDMGALGTPLMYAFREREKILDLIESLTGARMMCNYMRFGGCRCDLPPGWVDAAKKVVAEYPRFLDEFETLLSGNEILMARTQGVGKVSAELAVNAGLTGPMLRATGVNYDLRKVDAYGVYSRFNFRVPLGAHGDVYDRYMIRILEMRESIKILHQALAGIPAGPIMDPKYFAT